MVKTKNKKQLKKDSTKKKVKQNMVSIRRESHAQVCLTGTLLFFYARSRIMTTPASTHLVGSLFVLSCAVVTNVGPRICVL